ncbi:MAG TPA: glycosyltransferase family 4 protein [Cyclobacteriaceae bacterium]|nr:glycosyltransferase family 4 protein [Cyclobacteriaceae bacterium]
MTFEKASPSAPGGSIAFVVPYPLGIAPGQRFRFEHYLPHLRERGYKIKVYPFLCTSTYSILYKPGRVIRKLIGVTGGFMLRILQFPMFLRADWIFIYREATPLGPPMIEWLLSQVFRKKIIFDFDDAIWLPVVSAENPWITRLKYPAKIKFICSISHRVSVGNQYLFDFAKQYTSRVQINPTVLNTDTSHVPMKKQDDGIVRIGWTGSHSTLPYLKIIETVLQHIEQRYPNVEVVVIADQPPTLALNRLNFIPWSKANEAADLNRIDIGIMPLSTDEWSLGKCGFKALQYMAVGVPAVASPVGVNRDIITDGIHGFLCDTESSWEAALVQLIEQPGLRRKLGAAGRQHVTENYSVSVNAGAFCRMFTNSSINPRAIT